MEYTFRVRQGTYTCPVQLRKVPHERAPVYSPSEAAEEEVEEEEEVSLVEIKGHGNFYTTNQVNGDIYKIDADEEVGEQVGKFVSSIPVFF